MVWGEDSCIGGSGHWTQAVGPTVEGPSLWTYPFLSEPRFSLVLGVGRGRVEARGAWSTWLLAVILIVGSVGLSGCVTGEEPGATGGSADAGDDTSERTAPDTPAGEDGSAPSAEEEAGEPDHGDLILTWPAPTEPDSQAYQDAFRDAQTFSVTVELLNAILRFPYDIQVEHVECDEANAFYDPNTRQVVLCYEMLALIGDIFDDPSFTDEDYTYTVSSAWLWIFFHELGHALVDAYDLPITGREEDAVDDLATLTWIDLGAPGAALSAAFFWYGLDDGEYTEVDFADEHSLTRQRFFQTMCTVYGTAPTDYQWLVEDGHLPPDRAERCPSEYQQKDDAWTELLEPWMKTPSESELPDRLLDFPDSLPRPSQSEAPSSGQGGTLASDERISIPAGETYHHGVELSSTATITYAFEVVDTSSLEVGIIEYEDLEAYQNGQQVSGWETYSNVQQATGEVELPTGTYALVLYCMNSYFACDLDYSFAMSGAAGGSGGEPSSEPQTEHHASQRQIAIAAGDVYEHHVDLTSAGAISYWFEVLDTSTLDVGIIRAEDVEAYRSGQSVDAWAYHSEVQWAEDGSELPADRYAFILYCLNSFNNCDLEYSLASAT